MKYLKVFTDFACDMEELSDAECGRLFRAMLQYAQTGEAPKLNGNERFTWRTAKKNIDRQLDDYKERCETNKRIATNRYATQRNVTPRYETCQDKDKDKDKTGKENPLKGVKESAAQPRFRTPTVEQIAEYCKERGNAVDPARFFDFYASKGWRVGNQPMKDWKACVRTWEQRDGGKKDSPPRRKNPATAYEQHTVTDADLSHLMVDLDKEDTL